MTLPVVFLAALGLLYIALSIWCSYSLEQAAGKVGISLDGGSGRSEFVTVYGGLEFGLGLVFLLPLVQSDTMQTVLLVCVLVHGSLAIFRAIGFLFFSGIGPMTKKLAVGEWVIFLLSLAILLISPGS